MQVALVNEHFSEHGSLDSEVVLLARHLASSGVDVHVYCDERQRDAEAPATFHDVPPRARGSRTRLGHPVEIASFAWRATRLLSRDRAAYDIVHVAGQSAWLHDVLTVDGVTGQFQREWAENAPARLARLRSRIAPVTRPQIAVLRTIERLQFRRGRYRRVIARTPGVKAALLEHHGVDPAVVDVIPFPITAEPGTPADGAVARASLGVGADDRLVLFVGHAFERKGLEEACRGVAGTDAQLVVVGEGDPGPYRQLAAALGIRDRVRFVGPTTSPGRYFAAADVLLAPSRQEAWGIPVIEAMAHGVPVVTLGHVGAASEVARARAGTVLEDSSPAVLQAALDALLRDRELRLAMGRRGRAAAEAYRPEAVGAATLETYRRALAGA